MDKKTELYEQWRQASRACIQFEKRLVTEWGYTSKQAYNDPACQKLIRKRNQLFRQYSDFVMAEMTDG